MKKILTFLAAFFCITAAFAQDIKIVTGHPDFKVKVARCEANGKNVILDLLFTNVSSQDVEDLDIWGSCYKINHPEGKTIVYDSEGNIYNCSNRAIKIKVSNGKYQDCYENLKLISDVPMKVSIMISGVPNNVEALARVDLDINIPLFNITSETPVKIKNIPISR